MTTPQPQILTVAQAAEFLQCHQSTIYRLAKRKLIPCFRLGSSWRFERQTLLTWMQKQTNGNG